ncbi:GILT-like protein 1 [Ischnura elegans]|uniref:GILT-like protein 1 n=1 Tax=Ischnura elegans TaxID=197161 RepID=UPI001ED8AEAD|nr:GILT-like protein 1 [Ischnura elegans]
MTAIAAILVLAAFSAFSSTEAQTPVQVDIYYESLCTDSIAFITKQFYPTYQKMGKYMKVNFIPYGNSNKTKDEATGGYTFVCQHGPEECYGNKVQSCALVHIMEDKKKVAFINCVMSAQNVTAAGLECATDHNIEFPPIDTCVNGAEGNITLAKMGDKTDALNPRLTSVPTVVFDMMYKVDEQKMATSNFMSALCSHIMGTKPTECAGQSGATFSAYAVPSLVFALAAILPAAVVH